MDAIFHEKQDGSLCAQHCLNALLQGEYFTAVDLASLAQQMDEVERLRMAEGGVNSEEYRLFLQEPSSNMDDSGYFSIQVIASALEVWNLEIVPFNSQQPIALEAKVNPIDQTAFICNYRDHWFSIRKLGNQWFNLNSLLSGPELISDTYLAMFLAQLQQEGYSIFIIVGGLPDCEADELLKLMPAVQTTKPHLLTNVRISRPSTTSVKDAEGGPSEHNMTVDVSELQAALSLSLKDPEKEDEPVDPDTVRNRRLEYFQKGTPSVVGGNSKDCSSLESARSLEQSSKSEIENAVVSEEMSEEAMLEAALKMSMEQETG